MSKRIDLTGKTFGSWSVLAFERSDKRFAYWRARCACGSESVLRGDSLRLGGTKMCQACQIGALAQKITTHGQSNSPTWKSWHSMRMRCLSPHASDYGRYGGAGIGIDPAWDDFGRFLSDMGERPSRAHTVDRIDPTKGYGPGNCRWATSKQQNRNKKRTVYLTSGGVRRPLVEWAEVLGVRPVTLYKRHTSGWPDEKVVTQPVSRRTVAPA